MIMLIIIILLIIIMSGLSEINYMYWFYSLTSAENRTWITKKQKNSKQLLLSKKITK